VGFDCALKQVLAARLAPDGALAAVACETGLLLLYDVTRPRPREVKRVSAHFHHVLCLDWSPDGRYLVTGGADAVVSVWAEHAGWANAACFRLHEGYVRGVAWSPDGSLVASGGSDMQASVQCALCTALILNAALHGNLRRASPRERCPKMIPSSGDYQFYIKLESFRVLISCVAGNQFCQVE
jgi:hypothetical protein